MMVVLAAPIHSKDQGYLEGWHTLGSTLNYTMMLATEDSEFASSIQSQYSDIIVIDTSPVYSGPPGFDAIVAARNAIREEFLRTDEDILVFLDLDQAEVVTPDDISSAVSNLGDHHAYYPSGSSWIGFSVLSRTLLESQSFTKEYWPLLCECVEFFMKSKKAGFDLVVEGR